MNDYDDYDVWDDVCEEAAGEEIEEMKNDNLLLSEATLFMDNEHMASKYFDGDVSHECPHCRMQHNETGEHPFVNKDRRTCPSCKQDFLSMWHYELQDIKDKNGNWTTKGLFLSGYEGV